MGILPDAEGDYWAHDDAASTWTRMIVVPRMEYYRPGEGAEGERSQGPLLEDLGDLRKTITSDGGVTQDNWRKAEMSDGPDDVSKEWTGSCVFRERWSVTSKGLLTGSLSATGVGQVDRATDPPGKLVFTNIPEYSVVDDLSGDPLPASLVTLAKREEITEMYRRSVWTETSTSECVNATGKPPIPVRWVITNKGDKANYNVRARLVAKHLVAKWERD